MTLNDHCRKKFSLYTTPSSISRSRIQELIRQLANSDALYFNWRNAYKCMYLRVKQTLSLKAHVAERAWWAQVSLSSIEGPWRFILTTAPCLFQVKIASHGIRVYEESFGPRSSCLWPRVNQSFWKSPCLRKTDKCTYWQVHCINNCHCNIHPYISSLSQITKENVRLSHLYEIRTTINT